MPEILNPETHHERSDVNVRALLLFAAIFIVFAIVTHFVIFVMFRQFAKMARHTTASAPLTEMARPESASVPQEPRLQPFPERGPNGEMPSPIVSTPVVDLEQMRAHEQQALENPGWVDRQKGIVRIPIETAKELEVQRLSTAAPVTAAPPAPPSKGATR